MRFMFHNGHVRFKSNKRSTFFSSPSMELCIPLRLNFFSPVSFLVPEASIACEKENQNKKINSLRD